MGSRSEQWAHSRIFSNDNAVSIIVSAILLLGLLVSCIAFINVYYVPSWIADDEARHMRDVFVDFSAIPGCIDGLVLANETGSVSKQRIQLGGGDIPIIAPGTSWGILGVVPREANFTVKADIWVETISENFTHEDLNYSGVNLTNISGTSSFYISVMGIKSPNEYIVVDFTNQSEKGKVEIWIKNPNVLKITTWGRDGNKIVDEMVINNNIENGSIYEVDILNPCYGFSKVLSDANTPYNLTVTNTSQIHGSYTIEYAGYNKTIKHYTGTNVITSNGTLMYESLNRYFLNQKFIYQNGAVFLCQPPNVSMRIAPDISIEDVGGCAHLLIPMVTVDTGEHRIPMISGSGVEELQLELDHTNRIAFAEGNNTNSIHIIIEPPEGNENFRRNYLQEWANYFDATVEKTSVRMLKPTYGANHTNINITLNGSIHLEIRDTDIEGRISSIS